MGCASQVEHSRDHGEAVYFAYDGLMRKRIERDFAWNGGGWAQTNEILYVYDGNLVLQERDGHDEPLTTYTRGIDLSGTLDGAGGIGGLLARSDNRRIVPAILCPEHPNPQNAVTSYYFSDAQGNVVQLFAPNGMILAQYEYDPFDNLISKNGLMADMNKYRFSSKERDDNAGLYYYLYRFYDPDLQRWVNRDPNGEPGFEAMQLTTQPLSFRKLLATIDSPETHSFLTHEFQKRHNSFSPGGNGPTLPFSIAAATLPTLSRQNSPGIFGLESPFILLGPNAFGFVGNDPVYYIDPDGEQVWMIIGVVVGVGLMLRAPYMEIWLEGHKTPHCDPNDDNKGGSEGGESGGEGPAP